MVMGRRLSAPNKKKSDDFSVFTALRFDEEGEVVEGLPAWHNGTAADDWDMVMLE